MPAPWHSALLREPSEYDKRLAQIREDLRRAEVERRCGQPTRQWGSHNGSPCLLDKGHRGYHSISVFTCDQCGHTRRRPWAAYNTDSEGETDVVFCFPCVAKDRRPGPDW